MLYEPKIPKGHKAGVKHQRATELNQQTPTAVRPPLPRDTSGDGKANWCSGELPKGGYQSIWRFDGSTDTKNSPTVKVGRKVY